MGNKNKDDSEWSIAYTLGLISSGILVKAYFPMEFGHEISLKPIFLAFAGICVGYGTRLSNGCTSGHGLCGLSRLSYRSFVAVVTFMTTGFITAFISRNVISSEYLFVHTKNNNFYSLFPNMHIYSFIITSILMKRNIPLIYRKENLTIKNVTNLLVSYVSGFLFGLGLSLGGMIDTSRVLGFLNVMGENGWDYTLTGVLGCGVCLNLFAFTSLQKQSSVPILDDKKVTFASRIKIGLVEGNKEIDMKLIIGSAIFGIGWGLAGICPGPAVVMFGANIASMNIFIPSMLGGIVLHSIMH